MRLRPLRAAHAGLAVTLALAWSGILAVRHLEGKASFLDRIEAPLLDLRFALAGPRPAPPDILIVAIDDEAVREAGAYPLPRTIVGGIARTLHALGASAIGIDILFIDAGAETGDAALAAALSETGAVIAAAGTFGTGSDITESGPAIPYADRVLWPNERFRKVAAVGTVNIAADQGGTPRHAPLVVNGPEGILLSFPLRLAVRAAGESPALGTDSVRIGKLTVRTDLGWSIPLRFYGPRGTVRTISAATVMRGTVGRADIEGRLVLIGATAIGTADTFATPFDPVLPGVEVLATATAHLREGDSLIRDAGTRRIDAASSMALAGLTALGVAVLAPGAGLVFAILAGAAWLGATLVAFGSGYWLNAVMPFAAMAPGVAFGLLGRQALDRMQTRRLIRSEEAMRRFQAPALADRIASDPGFLAEPVSQPASVVFVDLSGFTGASERLGPERTRDMLKEFHAVLSEAVEGRGGVVMNFMGDGAMVMFGVPEPVANDAERALLAAESLVEATRSWLDARSDGLGADVGVRVGAHHGPVVLSRLGSAAQEQITATGDSVNVASRLMEVGKQLGAALVVSEDLLAAAGNPPVFLATVEGRRRVEIRGRVQPLGIAYRWAGLVPAVMSTKP